MIGHNPGLIMDGGMITAMDVDENLNMKRRGSVKNNSPSLIKWSATFGLQGLSTGYFSKKV